MAGGQKEISAKLVGNPFGEKEEGVVLVKLSQSASTALSEGNLDTAEMLEGLDDASIAPVFSGKQTRCPFRSPRIMPVALSAVVSSKTDLSSFSVIQSAVP